MFVYIIDLSATPWSFDECGRLFALSWIEIEQIDFVIQSEKEFNAILDGIGSARSYTPLRSYTPQKPRKKKLNADKWRLSL